MAACHDAIRKAITAHMLANGLRPRGGEGAHRIVLDYARSQLADLVDEDDLEETRRSAKTERWPSTGTPRRGGSTGTTSAPRPRSPNESPTRWQRRWLTKHAE